MSEIKLCERCNSMLKEDQTEHSQDECSRNIWSKAIRYDRIMMLFYEFYKASDEMKQIVDRIQNAVLEESKKELIPQVEAKGQEYQAKLTNMVGFMQQCINTPLDLQDTNTSNYTETPIKDVDELDDKLKAFFINNQVNTLEDAVINLVVNRLAITDALKSMGKNDFEIHEIIKMLRGKLSPDVLQELDSIALRHLDQPDEQNLVSEETKTESPLIISGT